MMCGADHFIAVDELRNLDHHLTLMGFQCQHLVVLETESGRLGCNQTPNLHCVSAHLYHSSQRPHVYAHPVCAMSSGTLPHTKKQRHTQLTQLTQHTPGAGSTFQPEERAKTRSGARAAPHVSGAYGGGTVG